MKPIGNDSLAATLDALNEALFFGRALTKPQQLDAARWLAGRQGLPGSYAKMFAPTPHDLQGVKLFTGERIVSRASISHILGEETLRLLALLKVNDPAVQTALAAARAGMSARLADSERRGYQTDIYCCGKCAAAMWRNLAVGGLSEAESRLAAGLQALKLRRTADGKWRAFPFYYTLLALNEIELPAARAELRHAALTCERTLRRQPKDAFGQRRLRLLERILAKC